MLETLENVRFKVDLKDDYVLHICTQEPKKFSPTKVSRIELYDHFFYKAVTDELIRCMVDSHNGVLPDSPIVKNFYHTISDNKTAEVSITAKNTYRWEHTLYNQVKVNITVSILEKEGSSIPVNYDIASLYGGPTWLTTMRRLRSDIGEMYDIEDYDTEEDSD